MCFLTCLLLASSRASPSSAPVIWQKHSLWSDSISSVLHTWVLILGHLFPTPVRDNLQLSQVPSIFTQRNVACLSWSSSWSVEDVFPNLPGDWAAGQLIPSCSFLLIDNHMSDCSPEVSVMFSDPLMPVTLALWSCNLVNNTQLNHAWEKRNVLWKGECFGKANYFKKEMKLN